MIKKILLLLIIGSMAYGCYDPLEINTKDIGKVELPIVIGMPLMDGSFVLEFDSYFSPEEFGDDLITYDAEGRAIFKYDTVMDFYDELEEFLDMADLDFTNMTTFEESFNLITDIEPFSFNYTDNFTINTIGGPIPIPVDTMITIDPQDTFKTKYGANAIFVAPLDSFDYRLDVLNVGDPIELNIPYDLYKVEVASGLVNLRIRSSDVPSIADDFMTMSPSMSYQYSAPPVFLDTTLSQELSVPIYKNMPQLPKGVHLIAEVKIGSLKSVIGDLVFDKHYVVSSLDTAISLNLADYYYYSVGDGLIDIDLQIYMEITTPEDTAVIPLPDTLYFGTSIDDLVFEHVVFNYGFDTAMSGSQEIDFNVFSSLPENLEIEGFYLSDPEVQVKVQSNLGFAALFDIDSLMFTTSAEPELITDDGTASILIPSPTDPMDATVYIPSGKDSIHLDSASSRLEEVELLNIDGLLLSYTVVINPDDEAGMTGMHNFFYDYNDAIAKDMYDVKLSADIIIPFHFKFDKISFQETMELPFESGNLDSMIYLSDTDTISLEVKMYTKDFPFNATAQFYFDEVNSVGGLSHMDSMFSSAKKLLPSSSDGILDSAIWELMIDSEKYESIKGADSLTLQISMSMDEHDYFQLKEGASTEIGYDFSIGKSSFVLKQDGTDE